MSLQAFEPSPEAIRERIVAYSYPGFGKTCFVTSLPDTPKWGEILYYAADEGSEFLGSVMPKYRPRIHVLKPDRDDPMANFTEFAIHDWRKEYPKVRTLIVDTYSKVAFDIIMHAANKGWMTQEKHYQVGVPGQPGSQAIPNRSDYFAVQSVSRGMLDMIFHHQRDMNIIFVMHEDIFQVEGVGAVGGPSHPGRTMALELPSKFNTVIRLTREVSVDGAGKVKTTVFANTDSQGQYIARIREALAEGNPMPKVALDRDPGNFWTQYDSRDFNLMGSPVANTKE